METLDGGRHDLKVATEGWKKEIVASKYATRIAYILIGKTSSITLTQPAKTS